MNIWLLILGMALVTYIPRLLPMRNGTGRMFPAWARQGLEYVPVAMLSALIAAQVLPSQEWLNFTVDGRLWAGLVAVGLSRFTRSALLTVAGGLAVLLLLS